MALPLLLAAGAGILGGAQYLMKRQDQARANSMFSQMQSDLANSALSAQDQNQILARAQNAIDNDSFWNRQMVTSQLENLSGYALQADANKRATFAANQFAMQQQMVRDSFARQDQMDADYNRDLGEFQQVQVARDQALASLGDGHNSADKIAALYNFFSIIDPGRAVQGNEAALFNSVGGLSAKGENWWNGLFGKGINDTSREEILQAIERQYQPKYENAQRVKSYYDRQYKDYWNRGYRFVDPAGSLGIRWNDQPRNFNGSGGGGGGGGGNPDPKPGDTVTGPNGQTLTITEPRSLWDDLWQMGRNTGQPPLQGFGSARGEF